MPWYIKNNNIDLTRGSVNFFQRPVQVGRMQSITFAPYQYYIFENDTVEITPWIIVRFERALALSFELLQQLGGIQGESGFSHSEYFFKWPTDESGVRDYMELFCGGSSEIRHDEATRNLFLNLQDILTKLLRIQPESLESVFTKMIAEYDIQGCFDMAHDIGQHAFLILGNIFEAQQKITNHQELALSAYRQINLSGLDHLKARVYWVAKNKFLQGLVKLNKIKIEDVLAYATEQAKQNDYYIWFDVGNIFKMKGDFYNAMLAYEKVKTAKEYDKDLDSDADSDENLTYLDAWRVNENFDYGADMPEEKKQESIVAATKAKDSLYKNAHKECASLCYLHHQDEAFLNATSDDLEAQPVPLLEKALCQAVIADDQVLAIKILRTMTQGQEGAALLEKMISKENPLTVDNIQLVLSFVKSRYVQSLCERNKQLEKENQQLQKQVAISSIQTSGAEVKTEDRLEVAPGTAVKTSKRV